MKNKLKIGILHPGEMGISVAYSAIKSGNSVFWISNGRSNETKERAKKYNLIELNNFKKFCDLCSIILCICPPEFALEEAKKIASSDFKGIYVDANAISPQLSKEINKIMIASNINYVDGGIIGGPAWGEKLTVLYLSGYLSKIVVKCFDEGPLSTKIISKQIGKASALKMCYSAKTKGITALLTSVISAASEYGVLKELESQWNLEDSKGADSIFNKIKNSTPKAWRFYDEMLQIANTFDKINISDGFFTAASEIYQKMKKFKKFKEIPSKKEIIKEIIKN